MSEHDHRMIVEAESYDWATDIAPVESVEKRLIRSLVGLTATTTLTSIKLTGWAFGTAKEATRQIVQAAAEAAAEAAESANVQSERRAENTTRDGSRTENLRAAMATRTNRKQSVEATLAALRARGDRLLDRSADVTDRDDLHPAYDRILDEIAPDEARILRLLATSGAQPSVDVRTARPFGQIVQALDELQRGLDEVQAAAAKLPCRPRVYFEEWDEPMISAIRWVSELITIAGGEDVFPELALEPSGKARIIADPAEIIRQLDLRRPIYRASTHYGHFGKKGLPWETTSKLAAFHKALSK